MLRHAARYIITLSALLLSLFATSSEHSKLIEDIHALAQKTNDISNQFFREYSIRSKNSFEPIENLQALESQLSQTKNFSSVIKLHRHLNLINTQFDHKITPRIIQHLLDNNDYQSTREIFEKVEQTGDRLLVAKTSIPLAEYYNRQKQWQHALNLLDLDLDDLSERDSSQASMAKGLALQGLKHHRRSIKEYEKVFPGTPFYQSAQINISVALFRQDWWTDAHVIIQDLLKPDSNLNDEYKDRLYLMLGYSFFNKEYYRESREAFRNISLDSIYTNRAIMGLTLAAVAQQDYLGALNTLTILNKKQSNELVVEETYLLLPNLYQKLQQFSEANLAYQQGISYYEQRISQLNLITPAVIAENFAAIREQQRDSIQLADTRFELSELYPDYFQQNLVHLSRIKTLAIGLSLEPQLDALLKEYQVIFEQATSKLVEQRVNALSSYLSQAKYGLARLYDTTDE